MKSIKWYIQNLPALVSNFIYFRKKNWYNVLHKLFPSMHKYKWHWVMECGCCGFEGAGCEQCDSTLIIGHASDNWDDNGNLVESGDIVEYNY